MMELELSTDQRCLLENTKNLPPDWWLDCCDTPDRKYRFYLVRFIYEQTRLLLQQYFSGSAPKLDCSDKIIENLIKEQAKEYRLLYSLIFDAWEYLEEYFKIIDSLLSSHPGVKGSLKDLGLTPGLVVSELFEEDAEQTLRFVAFPESVTGNSRAEFGFSKTRSIVKELNEVLRKLKSSNPPYQLPKKQALYVADFHRNYPVRSFLDRLLKKAAVQDPNIRKSLEELKYFREDSLRAGPAAFHPDRVKHYSVKSYVFEKGVVIPRQL